MTITGLKSSRHFPCAGRLLKWMPLVIGTLCLLEAQCALAQSPLGPPSLRRPKRPTVSPYLNLAAAGGNPDAVAFQYFERVLPDANLRKLGNQQALAITDLDAKLLQQRKLLLQSKTSTLSGTGHRTQFQNYGTYFNKAAR